MSDSRLAIRARLRQSILAITGCAMLLLANGAWARCGRDSSFVPGHAQVSVGTIEVSPYSYVGQVLYTREFQLNFSGNMPRQAQIAGQSFSVPAILASRCDPSGGYHSMSVTQGMPLPGFRNVFSTSVAGIGIRLSFLSTTAGFHELPFVQQLPPSSLNYFPYPNNATYTVELIKVAPFTGSGPLTNGVYAQDTLDNGEILESISVLGYGRSSGVYIVTKPSCAVDSNFRSIQVPMGKVHRTEFKGVGSTAAQREFNIRVQCSGTANVTLRLDAAPDPSGLPGVLRLTQSDVTAQGVGIQLLDSYRYPVQFGGTTQAVQLSNESHDFKYFASYLQTSDEVTTGQADGTATLTLYYY